MTTWLGGLSSDAGSFKISRLTASTLPSFRLSTYSRTASRTSDGFKWTVAFIYLYQYGGRRACKDWASSVKLMADILDYFPLDAQPRDRQVKALKFVEDRVRQGFRDIVIAAPTGIGKSGIGAALAYWAVERPLAEGQAPGAYYLVTQKLLQDQLERDFDRYRQKFKRGQLIKTAEEYSCPLFKNCGAGGRAPKGCSLRRDGSCCYRQQKAAFLQASLAVTNYPYFFAERTYTGELEARRLLVADECHSLPDQIMRFMDVTVGAKEIKRWTDLQVQPDFNSTPEYAAWLEHEFLPPASEMLEELLALTDLDDDDSREVVELDKFICKVRRASQHMQASPAEWVTWRDDYRDQPGFQYTARPLSAAPYVDLVQSAAPVRVYMSAYPGVKDVFCRELGLDPDKVAWASLGSSFSPKRRPVISLPLGSMGSASKQSFLRVNLVAVAKLASRHTAERGLIHCGSYELGQQIAQTLEEHGHKSRIIFPNNADEREAAFQALAQSSNGIIVSPSMMEGFDFAGDLARWQVIAKVAYPYLGDHHVRAKMERDEDWYRSRAVMSTIQAAGRVCRSEDDFGVTYIVDSDFRRLYERTAAMWPKWFQDAVILA